MAAATTSIDNGAAVVSGGDAKAENDNIEAAQEVTSGGQGGAKRGLEKVEKIYIGVMVLAVLAIALTLGLVFGLRKTETVMATSVPTTMAPSEMPSSAPTGPLDFLMMDLPSDTLQSLQDFGTPQYMAFEWLSGHPNLTNLPEWRKRQLFALATFFYAFEGEHWPEAIRNNWLDESRDECDWFSSIFGDFSAETGFAEEVPFSSIDQCNERGEFQSLALSGLELAGSEPFVPPELALLTSLENLFLNRNDINTTLSAMIPSELSQLANLAAISFANNSLNGTIPAEVLQSLMALRFLDLSNNSLTGVAPELNQLETFNVIGNNLSG